MIEAWPSSRCPRRCCCSRSTRADGLVPTADLAALAAAASIDLCSEARIAAVDLGGGKTGAPSEIEAFRGSGH
jgi:hypothetical protein